ncbi:cytochrome c biogenesis protein [Mucisphaera calidilacus]|uniref:Cytochrome c biogenesis protein CcsA n=1 Tax=Mucisphaera calidilacus TaxID=2527982 RepID=A0A518BYN9_9BACT|nr:cytochrome c biogenesis protein CcsA [Mucisphaera calidilacus]QDU72092.1 Cytochrome c biogenesis protein CcsA [Mucisphaera calidilacus]
MKTTHTVIAVLLLLASLATAQVRPNVDGNTLPDTTPDAMPEAHAEHGHALDDWLDIRQQPRTTEKRAAFADALKLEGFRRLAVYDGGRVKILDTLAREQIQRIFGKARFKHPETGYEDPVFTYLDLLFMPDSYSDLPLVHVEVLPLRRQLVAHLEPDEQEDWLKRARLSPNLLASPPAMAVLSGRGSDLRLQKGLSQVWDASSALNEISDRLLLVSPLPADNKWHAPLDELDAHFHGQPLATGDVSRRALNVAGLWRQLGDNWRLGDTNAVNEIIATLTHRLPLIRPETYPPQWKLDVEHIYNATARFTIGYLGYLFGGVLLLLAFATGRPWLIRTGAVLGIAGFIIHTLGILARIALTNRWPIHNQFESFIAVTWFAVLVGLVLMWYHRAWLYGAAASALGAASLMVANTFDIPSADPGKVAGILATSRILYIHVNIVLISYGLIALGFFVSLFYLATHYLRGQTSLRVAAAGVGAIDENDTPAKGRQGLLRDLDQAQLLVLQLAFWLLGVGILLGAYWADHAWGRWWAWDPKETWALITWIIYLIAIHARFGVKDRGLVTAWLSVVGFVVMLWCYWGVNMLLAGLHSYA